MLKSKLLSILSLSLLLNSTSTLVAVQTDKTSRNETDDPNTRPLKTSKVVPQKKERERKKLRVYKESLITHNKEVTKPKNPYAPFSRDYLSRLSLFLDIKSFVNFFSINHSFYELGEELIQRKPYETEYFPVTLNVPFRFAVPVRRPHLLTRVARENLIDPIEMFEDIPNPYRLDVREFLQGLPRSSHYFLESLPTVSAFFNYCNAFYSPFGTIKLNQTAREKFRTQMILALQNGDQAAHEMVLWSDLSSKKNLITFLYPEDEKNLEQRTLIRKSVVHNLITKSDDPNYLVRLAEIITQGVYEIWTCIGIHLLEEDEDLFNFMVLNWRMGDPRSMDEALERFKNDRERNVKASVFTFVADETYCPSMMALVSLVNLHRFFYFPKNNSHNRLHCFHPEKLDMIEALLLRLLDFGNKGQAYTTFVDFGFQLEERNVEALAQDPSIINMEKIRTFALDNLLLLYIQKGESEKVESVVSQRTVGHSGDSHFAVGNLFQLMGKMKKALQHFDISVTMGNNSAIYALYDNAKISRGMRGLTGNSSVGMLRELAKFSMEEKDYERALIYLERASVEDTKGEADFLAAMSHFFLGDAEKCKTVMRVAADKGFEKALDIIRKTNKSKADIFEVLQELQRKGSLQ
jgi:hypothetical protein